MLGEKMAKIIKVYDFNKGLFLPQSEWNDWLLNPFSLEFIGYLQSVEAKNKQTNEIRQFQIFLEEPTLKTFNDEEVQT